MRKCSLSKLFCIKRRELNEQRRNYAIRRRFGNRNRGDTTIGKVKDSDLGSSITKACSSVLTIICC